MIGLRIKIGVSPKVKYIPDTKYFARLSKIPSAVINNML
jgi:hypothetical protein